MLRQAIRILKNMGLRYALYRVGHEHEKKTGLLKRRHPTDPAIKQFVPLDEFRANTPLFVIPNRENITFPKHPNVALNKKTTSIVQGEIRFFSSEWNDLSKEYDWITNSDCGGIQEEAPSLGKPVLEMRNTTERPKAVEVGTVKLFGTNYDLIVPETSQLLDDDENSI